MRTKLEKSLKTAAAAIFVAALGLNIMATLDGSAIYSDAIAQVTGETGDTGDYTGGTDGDFGYREDSFKVENEDRVEGYAKVDASGTILKVLAGSFEGGVKIEKKVKYTCCGEGSGYCSKKYTLCKDVSLFDLLVGTAI